MGQRNNPALQCGLELLRFAREDGSDRMNPVLAIRAKPSYLC
jgi:hypothetical protein